MTIEIRDASLEARIRKHPGHRLQQRRGSAAPLAGSHLNSVILSEATASRMRSSRAVEGSLPVCNAPSSEGFPPALSTARQNSMKCIHRFRL
jgi:hypothetical protein